MLEHILLFATGIGLICINFAAILKIRSARKEANYYHDLLQKVLKEGILDHFGRISEDEFMKLMIASMNDTAMEQDKHSSR